MKTQAASLMNLRALALAGPLLLLAACATTQEGKKSSGPNGPVSDSSGKASEVKISSRALLLFEDANKTWDVQKKSKTPDYAAASRKYEAALAADEQLAEADYNLGVISERQGRLDEAKVHYTAALKKKPSLRQAAENLAVMSQNAGDPATALGTYGEIARQYPDDAQSRARMAELYRQAGDHDKAMDYARQALIRDPSNIVAHKAMMNSYLDRKQLALSRLVAVRTLKLNDRDPDVFYALGQVQLLENQPEKAQVQFLKATESDPGYTPAHIQLAKLALKNEDFTNAQVHLRKVIQADSKNAEAHLNLGVACKGLGQYDKAMQEYDQAEKLNPNLAAIYLNRGIILHRQKDAPDKAIVYYKKYLELSGNGVGVAADAPVHALLKEAEQIVSTIAEAKRVDAEQKKFQELQKQQQDSLKKEDIKGGAKPAPKTVTVSGAVQEPTAVTAKATENAPVKNPAPAPVVKQSKDGKPSKDKDEPSDSL